MAHPPPSAAGMMIAWAIHSTGQIAIPPDKPFLLVL